MRFPFIPYLLLVIISQLSSFYSKGQVISNHFTHYTEKEGLTEGPLNAITQDSSGYLWIASNTGLSRFDGYTFKPYRYSAQDTNSLRENFVLVLFLDSKQRLWAITPNWLHLYHPDGDWFEHFSIKSIAADDLWNRCTEDGGYLIITGHKHLYKFDLQHKKFSVFNQAGIATEIVEEYKKDDRGVEWLGTESGLIRHDPGRKEVIFINPLNKTKDQKGSHLITDIIFLSDEYLLAATYNRGLLLVNKRTNTFEQFETQQVNPESPLKALAPGSPMNDRVDCTYKINDSIILCSCGGGISTFNWRQKTFSFFKPEKSDPSSLMASDVRIHSIFCDREGIIWLGGRHLEKHDFEDYNIRPVTSLANTSDDLPFAPYYEMHRCADGKFLLGGYADFGIYDPSLGLKNYHSGYKINFFNEDSHGNIWCFANRSVGFFNVNNFWLSDIKEYRIPGNITGIFDVKTDNHGKVLIATKGGGLEIFDTSTKTFTFINATRIEPMQLSGSAVRAICEDHNGCIWTGAEKSINKIEKDGKTIKQYKAQQQDIGFLTDWLVMDIKEDKQGIIWFTTNALGIGRIDPTKDSVSFISTAQGLPTSSFEELCIDDYNNLWALSKMGIINLNVVTLQNKICTEIEGFPPADAINTVYYSNDNKKLYILTSYSILEVDTKSIYHENKMPKTSITGVSIFDKDKAVTDQKPLNLNYNENFINIQFACLLFHSNRQIKYAYKMDGIDKDWVYCNYKRNASYTNLPPGSYTFNVKTQSPSGVWNEPTLLSIIINPPFWQTWWFYLGELIAGIALILWMVRSYTGKKLARQKIEIEKVLAVSNERTRIASDMHDEMGAGLTSIRLLSEIANQKIGADNSAKKEIEKIARSAGHLSENLKEIIWTVNTRYDVLEDFIIYIRTYAVEYFDNTSTTFEFNRPALIPPMRMAGELRRNVFLCIKEALHNIIKHSQATKASLTFEITDDALITTIWDNGIGIDAQRINRFGNGLNIMKDRLKKLDTALEIETNSGTKLTFRLKFSNDFGAHK